VTRRRITLTNTRQKTTTTVLAHWGPYMGFWITERVRRSAFHRMQADPDDPNAGVTASLTLTAWHAPIGRAPFKTYTMWNSQ
jgi:hypothetical protein